MKDVKRTVLSNNKYSLYVSSAPRNLMFTYTGKGALRSETVAQTVPHGGDVVEGEPPTATFFFS